MYCHSFMVLNRVSNETTADWLSQTHMENNIIIIVEIMQFFSVVEIPITHSS